MIKRIVAFVAALLGLGSIIVGVGASPALADTSCPYNWICLWTDHNYTGTSYKKYVGDVWGGYELSAYGKNKISSIKYTEPTSSILLFNNDSCYQGGHDYLEISAGGGSVNIPDLGLDGWGYNDKIESFAWRYNLGSSAPPCFHTWGTN